jgi:predicted membrane protein
MADFGLVQFLIALVIIGAGLYLLNLAPIDGTIKRIIQVVVIVVLIVMAIKLLLPMAGLG